MRADGETSTKPLVEKCGKVLSVKKRLGSNVDSPLSSLGSLNEKDLKAIRITTDFQEGKRKKIGRAKNLGSFCYKYQIFSDADDPVPEKIVKLSARFSNVPQNQDKSVNGKSKNVSGFDNFIIKSKGMKVPVTSTTSVKIIKK